MVEKNYPSMLTVRISVEQHEKLRSVAAQEEISASDLVRELIANRLGE